MPNTEVQVGPFGLYLAPRKPRKDRAQLYQWRADRTERPYLIEHPEREIAEEYAGTMRCPACSLRVSDPSWQIGADAVLRSISAAHAHNAAMHPRRHARSQHFQAPIPTEIRERVAS